MIVEVITTYLLTVKGYQELPNNWARTCSCTSHSMFVDCEIGNLLTGDGVQRVVYTTGLNGEPVTADVTVECRQ